MPSTENQENLPIYEGVVDELGDIPHDVATTAETVLKQARDAVGTGDDAPAGNAPAGDTTPAPDTVTLTPPARTAASE